MIAEGEIEAERFGNAYMIDSKYVAIIKARPEKRGRKRKIRQGEITA